MCEFKLDGELAKLIVSNGLSCAVLCIAAPSNAMNTGSAGRCYHQCLCSMGCVPGILSVCSAPGLCCPPAGMISMADQ